MSVERKDCYNCGGLKNTARVLCARCQDLYEFTADGRMVPRSGAVVVVEMDFRDQLKDRVHEISNPPTFPVLSDADDGNQQERISVVDPAAPRTVNGPTRDGKCSDCETLAADLHSAREELAFERERFEQALIADVDFVRRLLTAEADLKSAREELATLKAEQSNLKTRLHAEYEALWLKEEQEAIAALFRAEKAEAELARLQPYVQHLRENVGCVFQIVEELREWSFKVNDAGDKTQMRIWSSRLSTIASRIGDLIPVPSSTP